MMTKDPYCEVYKVVFDRAETHAREILRSRLIIGAAPRENAHQLSNER